MDFKGKYLNEVKIPTSAPYTLTGLRTFLKIDNKTWLNYKVLEDYFEVITRVEDIIFTHKFEGAVVGVFNANIIARELGLVDKQKARADSPA